MIHNKEPIAVLWDFVKSLKSQIPIYREIMHEEEKDVPESYILLRSKISDSTKTFGDGKSLIRTASCDIILITKGYADNSSKLHNTNKERIREKLKSQEVNFTEINLGYNDSIQSTEHDFTFEVEYFG